MSKPKRHDKQPPAMNAGTDDAWLTNPEAVRRFITDRPTYERLCAETQYIVEKVLRQNGVQVAHVLSRAKSLESFLEKVSRKSYDDPFAKITDLAGVRIVCLYPSDVARIGRFIEKEFDVLEKVDKSQEHGTDRFGYGAVHFVARLGMRPSGARYDDLKGLPVEIQVRTVLQDAWAIIDHHLVYKRESDIPSLLQRKLNSLAGLFETADDQFEQVRKERDAYLAAVAAKAETPRPFLEQELNLDTLRAYAAWKFPDAPPAPEYYLGERVLRCLPQGKYSTLQALDDAVSLGLPAVAADIRDGTSGPYEHAGQHLSVALAFVDPDHLRLGTWGPQVRKAFQSYRDLVEPEA